MPRWIISAIVILVCLSFLPLAAVYVTRAQRNGDTRMSIIPDMDDQQKFKAQQINMMFADHRAMRPQVEGTVAEGDLHEDSAFYRGIEDGHWVQDFPKVNPETGQPLVIDKDFILRGQDRFNIYCSVCHGLEGDGQGMVSKRVEQLSLEGQGVNTWTPPLSYHTKQVRDRPNGHIFNTITNGIRNMPPYGPQIAPIDRWAIVAYVRALERSQEGTVDDLSPADRKLLESQKPPPKSATEEAKPATPEGGSATSKSESESGEPGTSKAGEE